MISKILEFETINKLARGRKSVRQIYFENRHVHLEDFPLPLQCAMLFIGLSFSEMIFCLGSFTVLVKIMHMTDI